MKELEVRFHRGGLDESLKTLFKPTSWQDFCNKCKMEDDQIVIDSIESKLYAAWKDDRVGWPETWIISAKRSYGSNPIPIGFASGDVEALKNSYFL